MSHTDTGHIEDSTTERMIQVVLANGVKINAKDISVILILAGFRAFEIGMRIDAVIAGSRRTTARVAVDRVQA